MQKQTERWAEADRRKANRTASGTEWSWYESYWARWRAVPMPNTIAIEKLLNASDTSIVQDN